MALTPGTRLGPYEIVSPLGAGGMGEVYRARDTKLNRDVALKILPEPLAMDGDRIARFRREAQVLAALNHPNIAHIHGLEDSTGAPALVMELVEGPTLADRIAQGPIPVDAALAIAKQIADALEAAHEQGIIHRDLKPANIKLRPDGTVKLLDFGLAKAFDPVAPASGSVSMSPTLSVHATLAGVILGTAAYMSPEQANGLPTDARSDIFSFGCVLYEMLTGRQSFQGQTVSEVMASVLAREPDLGLLPPKCHPRLLHVLRRSLEKNTKRRWQSMIDVHAELEAVIADPKGAGLSAQPAARRAPLSKRAAGAVVAALLFTVIGAIAGWFAKPTGVSSTLTRFAFALPQGQAFTSTGRQVLAISPDGTRFVYVANNRLFLKPMGDLNSIAIQGTDREIADGIQNPVFSLDSRSLAFFSVGDKTYKRIAVSGGASVTVCAAEAPFGMNWGPNNEIVFGVGTKGVMRVSADGGKPETIVTVKDGELAHGPQMLPGSDVVLFTLAKLADGAERWDKANIVVQSLKTGQRKVLVEGGRDGRYIPTGHLVYVLRGTLLAIPFDTRRLETKGGPVPMVEGIRTAAGATGSSQFSFSDTGSLVYLPGQDSNGIPQRTLALADRNGGIKTLGVPPGPYLGARVSPNGKQVAFGTDDGKEAVVWVYDLSGTTSIRRLTFGGRNFNPIWSSDSQRIAFTSDREGDSGLFAQRADGTGAAERITKAEDGATHWANMWGPNNQLFVFYIFPRGNADGSLWTYSLQEKKAALYAATPGSWVQGASFSPDGRWIVYQSNETPGRRHDIFVQPFPPTGAKYQITRDGGNHPVWSPEGKEIFFVNNNADGRLQSVSVQTQPGLTFSSPVDLQIQGFFQGTGGPRHYDIIPGSKQFIMVFPPVQTSTDSKATPQIQVVLNWSEELKQRVPTR